MLRPGQEEFEALIQTYNPRTGNWLSDTKDILLRFFQDFFHEMPEGEGLFHYEPESGAAGEIKATDEIATELIISSAGAINTDTVEKRPAIVISRGPFGFGDTSIDALKGLDWTDGKETEKLALIVAKSIRYYRVTLQQAGFFNIGIRVQIGEESPANTLLHGDSDEDFVAVPVSFPVYYEEGWTLEYPNAASLDALKCTLNAVLRDFDGDLLYPDALDESGNPDPDSEGVIVSTWTMTS
jgi:hypothetical protein